MLFLLVPLAIFALAAHLNLRGQLVHGLLDDVGVCGTAHPTSLPDIVRDEAIALKGGDCLGTSGEDANQVGCGGRLSCCSGRR